MTAPLRHEQIGGFDALVLDSPANRNALSLRLLRELSAAVAQSAAGPGRGLVISHTGSSLCAGVDLRERRALGPADDSHSRLLGELFVALWNYPKPVVVALDGAVRGGGMGFLACGDVVLATPGSTFAYSEVRVGVAPALVMAVTMPTVPHRGLLRWLLSGATFGVAEALEWGLVTILDDEPRSTGVVKVVAEFTAGAPQAQQAVKRLARAAHSDVPTSVADMIGESAALFTSAEAAEGMTSFAERRPPSWVTAPGTAAPSA